MEKSSFDGERSRNRITVLKDGHTLAINTLLKSEMDLRREKRAASERRRAQQEVRVLLNIRSSNLTSCSE